MTLAQKGTSVVDRRGWGCSLLVSLKECFDFIIYALYDFVMSLNLSTWCKENKKSILQIFLPILISLAPWIVGFGLVFLFHSLYEPLANIGLAIGFYWSMFLMPFSSTDLSPSFWNLAVWIILLAFTILITRKKQLKFTILFFLVVTLVASGLSHWLAWKFGIMFVPEI
jgi:hypothetical protein